MPKQVRWIPLIQLFRNPGRKLFIAVNASFRRCFLSLRSIKPPYLIFELCAKALSTNATVRIVNQVSQRLDCPLLGYSTRSLDWVARARARARSGKYVKGAHGMSARGAKKRIRALHKPELAVALHKCHASAGRKCRHCSRPSRFGWCIAKTTARLRQIIFQEQPVLVKRHNSYCHHCLIDSCAPTRGAANGRQHQLRTAMSNNATKNKTRARDARAKPRLIVWNHWLRQAELGKDLASWKLIWKSWWKIEKCLWTELYNDL